MARIGWFLGVTAVSLAMLPMLGCEPPKQPSMLSTTSPPPPVGTDPQSQASQVILDGLADPDPQIRANSVEVVATTKQLRFMPRLQKLLHDEAVPVRFLAIMTVGDLEYSLARNEVGPSLNDPNPNIKMVAAYTMMKLGDMKFYKVFRDQVTSEDQTVRANAALLLGKTNQKDAIRFLYWALQRPDSADKVVLQALESIAAQHDERIYPKLWSRLISAYADDRLLGIRAMGALGTEQAKNAIITMLDDNIVEVRLAAAEALGRLGEPIGEAKVAEVFDKNLLADMDPEGQYRVKVLTALAIGEIGSESLSKHLPQLLRDPSVPVRLAAAKAVLRLTAK
jgi:HEAT repeat protein